LPERDLFATTWVPDPSLAADTGLVRPEFVWAALDCPGGVAAVDTKPRPILLGQLVVRIERPVRPNQRYMVIGWAIARSGRKHITGTALFTESGLLCAQGKAIWIEPKTEMTAGKILLKEDATEVRRVGETPWNFNLP
jgi:hypothetical protein